MLRRALVTAIVLLVAVLARPALAVNQAEVDAAVQRAYEAMFAEQLEQARRAGTIEADLKLGAAILDAAKRGGHPKELQVMLCEKAYELSMRSNRGYRSAVDALALLSRVEPNRSMECKEKLLAIYEKAFQGSRRGTDSYKRAGDATSELMMELAQTKIRAGDYKGAMATYHRAELIAAKVRNPIEQQARTRLADLQIAAAIDARLKQGQARLERDAQDKAAALMLVMVYLVDHDDPHRAAPHAELALDADKQELLTLAVFKPGMASAARYLDLAQWYVQLAGGAANYSRASMLIRARMYAEHALGRAGKDEALAARAQALLDSLKIDMARNSIDDGQVAARISLLENKMLAHSMARKDSDVATTIENASDTQVAGGKPQPADPNNQQAGAGNPSPSPGAAPAQPKPRGKSPLRKLPPPVYEKPKPSDDADFWQDRGVFDF